MNGASGRAIHVIDDRERIALYGICSECGAPRDAYFIEYHDGTKETRMVCTASVRPEREDWGHGQ